MRQLGEKKEVNRYASNIWCETSGEEKKMRTNYTIRVSVTVNSMQQQQVVAGIK